MRVTDIIEKKRDGGELSQAEIEFFVRETMRRKFTDDFEVAE